MPAPWSQGDVPALSASIRYLSLSGSPVPPCMISSSVNRPPREKNFPLRKSPASFPQRSPKRWGKEAGDFLKGKFFSRGGRLTLDEIMQGGTGEPLSDKYLIEALKAGTSP